MRSSGGAMRNSEGASHIGIYAGSFDPIHEGHLAFAKAAMESGLDKVMFLVEPRPRRKQGVRALEHRLAMVQIAVADEPKFGVIELKQARFTPHETVPTLRQLFKGAELYLLIGDDVLNHMVNYIAGWPNIDYLMENMVFIIAAREHQIPEIESSLQILKKTTTKDFRYQIISDNLPNFSSKQLRPELRRGNSPAGIPSKVLEYIKQNKLYSSEDNIS